VNSGHRRDRGRDVDGNFSLSTSYLKETQCHAQIGESVDTLGGQKKGVLDCETAISALRG